mmetsp:Transcript_22175/g.48668  ORF Transcript_22175/g.48668 Transcript_22175/m.48668 type:complete len:239 (-) Transcript_22175:836-1552(-)
MSIWRYCFCCCSAAAFSAATFASDDTSAASTSAFAARSWVSWAETAATLELAFSYWSLRWSTAACSFWLSSRMSTSSRILVVFSIFSARCPNCSADDVSLMCARSGEMLTMREVRAVPPKESLRRRVSLESRYGMCAGLGSVSEYMHLPSAVSDRLMNFASSSMCPSDPLFDILSEPAKSTMRSLPFKAVTDCCRLSELDLSFGSRLTVMMSREWLRLLVAFSFWLATTRLSSPIFKI